MNMKQKNFLKVLILISLIAINIKSWAQSQTEVWEKSTSYDVKTKTFYQFGQNVNMEEIPNKDVIMMKPSESYSHHNEYYSHNMGYIYEVTTEYDSDYPDWMVVPRKKIMNSSGISLYDINGRLTNYQPYNNAFPETDYLRLLNVAQNSGPFAMTNFSSLNEAFFDELRQIGYNVNLVGSVVTIQYQNILKTIDIENLHDKFQRYDENNQETYKIESTYYRDEYGRIIPKERVEIYNYKTSNNVPYKKIHYSLYTNFIKGGSDQSYNIPVDQALSTRNQLFGDAIILYPNPSSNFAFVSLPSPTSDDNRTVEILLRTLDGVIIDRYNADAGSITQIDITNLNVGSHIISVAWRNYTKYIHFLKL